MHDPALGFSGRAFAFEACSAGRLGGLHAALEQVKERLRGTYIDTGGAAGIRPRRNAVRQAVRPHRFAGLGAHQLQWRLRPGVRTAQTGGFGPAKSEFCVPRSRLKYVLEQTLDDPKGGSHQVQSAWRARLALRTTFRLPCCRWA
jgi:hypothetical protein